MKSRRAEGKLHGSYQALTDQQESDFSWGIVGVGFDDIEVPEPENIQDDTVRLFGQDPLEFEGVSLSPRSLPRSEPLSMFDRLPEAFGEEDKLPYSWMARNPGAVAKCLENKPEPVAIRPANLSAVNVQGEALLEHHLKRRSLNPNLYFYRVAVFCCIMDLNSAGLIYPSILATLVGRLFGGDWVLMAVFNQYFMPSWLHIECIIDHAAVQNILSSIERHTALCHPSSIPPNFEILIKVLNYMVEEQKHQGPNLNQTVGKLVSSSNGREFHPHPGLFTILRGPALSGRFMKRIGEWWPYKTVTWQQADLLGLHTDREAEKEDTVEDVDPRCLTVNGEAGGDIRAEARGKGKGKGSSRA
ncbi:hypothetical protein KVR01_011456 [Diaporthe batatas]|uniref:uncharacterized protein n=1 Tax=Diaporthe batatas TaxID=748121 RepID=UPI001D04B102|nr:uncharacterized protein KVR01_013822 [Diaporthe batatas]XP_044639831.1 uncharacterized protein KVR01_011456 [Diaporthe batatas]KAG8156287.1 hypothetical protein KVR01_013822 [Diaporthe batatas]KAG8159013.1 hypothetical protein KVR01_011456 [Diaporthe batatas]